MRGNVRRMSAVMNASWKSQQSQGRSSRGWSQSSGGARSSQGWTAAAGAAAGLAAFGVFASVAADSGSVDWDAVRADIEKILESNPNYDDGSYGPVLVRLAWHASGTYSKSDRSGGSNGATMRFGPEASDGANAGLDVARKLLEPIKQKYPNASYADLWTFAGVVAIEAMGGPKIAWRAGRSDATSPKACPPQGRLPDASKSQDHIREVFGRMGFNDREMVALIGAHTLGRCHPNRSGFSGPWGPAPTTFSNQFFIDLLAREWKVKRWAGPKQYEDESGNFMMLPTDMALLDDAKFRALVEQYAKDEDVFFKDFASAFAKLLELGVPGFEKGWCSSIPVLGRFC